MNLCLYAQDAAGFRGFNKIFKKNQVETRHALSLLIQFYYPELVEQNGFQYTFDIMDEKWDFLYTGLSALRADFNIYLISQSEKWDSSYYPEGIVYYSRWF
jgi:hypothetical protein